MTRAEFEIFQKELFNDCQKMATSKGNEYAGTENTHKNFIRLGEKLDLPPEKVLMVYLTKHLDSIDSYVKGGMDPKELTEPIRGRVIDAINYLVLLAAYDTVKKR